LPKDGFYRFFDICALDSSGKLSYYFIILYNIAISII